MIALAGGREALLELFAARLRGLFVHRGFIVASNDTFVTATRAQAGGLMFVLCLHKSWPEDALTEVSFEGYDLTRSIMTVCDAREDTDAALWEIYDAGLSLIAEWPEIAAGETHCAGGAKLAGP